MQPKPRFEAPAGWSDVEKAACAAAHDWPLPAAPYLPGMTPRPPGDDDVHRVADLAADPTVAERWRGNAAYLAGFRLYEAGYGWEAHEVWEPVWMKARAHSGEKHLVQGLIQLANARLKLAMERNNAARRLIGMAGACLEEAVLIGGQHIMGVDAAMLLREVRKCETADHLSTPKMHYNA